MDENELQNITEKITGRCVYAHTIAKDELTYLPVFKKPAIINCNTGNSNTQGEHWLTFLVYYLNESPVAEMYDSYGENCSFYGIKLPYKIINQTKNSINITTRISAENIAFFMRTIAYIEFHSIQSLILLAIIIFKMTIK